MGWIQLFILAFQFIFKTWDAIKEKNEELKKKKTEELQWGLRGIVDRDPSRVTVAFDKLNRLRGETDKTSSD